MSEAPLDRCGHATELAAYYRLLDEGVAAIEAEAVAAEKARIRAAVERAFAEASVDNEPGEFTCLSEAAVLRIIDGEDA